MHIHQSLFLLILVAMLASCQNPDPSSTDPLPPVTDELYFPPNNSNEWEQTSAESLGWDTNELEKLNQFLSENGTKAFLILKDGKIVEEWYYGNFTQDSLWYWASAGKGITAMLVGIAQEQGLLSIENPTSQYLGSGWTTMEPTQETAITIRHQLTMTTGLDEQIEDGFCTDPACLTYKAAPGSRWYYFNPPYTLLKNVIEKASGQNYNLYTTLNLRNKIGMNGRWVSIDYNNVYFSNARSMAKFGLLVLNQGKWNEEIIIQDQTYFQQMLNSSQDFNLSYGYLWWLNGKENYRTPSSYELFNGWLAPSAPANLVAAIGANGQILAVVPSQNLIVVRMGNGSPNNLVPLSLHEQIWTYLADAIK